MRFPEIPNRRRSTTSVMTDDLKVRRAEADRMRSFATRSWRFERRVVARPEATTHGFDIGYVVTSLADEARDLYEDVYCARGTPSQAPKSTLDE